MGWEGREGKGGEGKGREVYLAQRDSHTKLDT